MPVQDFLKKNAEKTPMKNVLVCGDASLTYGEFDRVTNSFARALKRSGIERGDRVMIFLPNSVETAIGIFGVLKAGCVFVPVNPGVKAGKLAYIADNCGARAIVTDLNGARVLGTGLSPETLELIVVTATRSELDSFGVGGLPTVGFAEFTAVSSAPVDAGTIDRDLACLIYTSGSTGEPKGVVCGHDNVVFASGAIVEYLGNTSDDIVINVLPFSFDYGLYQLIMVVRFGGTLVIENAFGFPAAILRTIARERVTGLPVVPTLVSMLMPMDLSAFDLSSLRYITNTAATLPPKHIASLRRLFPSVRIYSMYGMTECKRTLYLPPDMIDDRPGSVGVAIPGTEVWIEDEHGNRVGPNQTGELVVRGPHVMRGYWGDDELTSRVYRPGPTPGEKVLYSGDLFRRDPDGFHYFVSRKDDIIKSRGEKVSPKEVETAICELDGVVEAAVVGVPDDVLGCAIKAYVVVSDPFVAEQTVQRHCTARLEGFMVPHTVEFVSDLPKNGNGKIDKKELSSITVSPSSLTRRNIPFGRDLLLIDAAAEAARIRSLIRDSLRSLKRRGVIVAISGGIDSSVVLGLAVRAVGADRVRALMLPEQDSSPDTRRLSLLVARSFDVPVIEENITGVLAAYGCYERRNAAVRIVIPSFGPGYTVKIVLPSVVESDRYRVFSVVTEGPDGKRTEARLVLEAYLGLVAASNFKQRVRKTFEYYYADKLNYAVAGTPNRVEHDQGFFVKNGDGSADIKPIAHLYKSQVYQLAEYLGVPDEIVARPPTTDTYSMPQSQEEFYFSLPYEKMDLCLYARENGFDTETVAEALGLKSEQIARVFRDIDQKRRTTAYLHATPVVI